MSNLVRMGCSVLGSLDLPKQRSGDPLIIFSCTRILLHPALREAQVKSKKRKTNSGDIMHASRLGQSTVRLTHALVSSCIEYSRDYHSTGPIRCFFLPRRRCMPANEKWSDGEKMEKRFRCVIANVSSFASYAEIVDVCSVVCCVVMIGG